MKKGVIALIVVVAVGLLLTVNTVWPITGKVLTTHAEITRKGATCVDPDGQYDIKESFFRPNTVIKTETKGALENYPDRCLTKRKLLEYYCPTSRPRSVRTLCAKGCIETAEGAACVR